MLKKISTFALLAIVLVGSFTLAGTMLRYRMSLPAAISQLLAQATSNPSVTSYTLINAETDQAISGFETLQSGATINLASLPTRKLNIRVNTNPYALGSVRFSYDASGSYKLQDIPPYAIGGASPAGDYYAWTPTVGDHTLKVTPYTGKGGTGTAGTALTITFKVIDVAGPSNNFKVILINTDTQQAVPGYNPIADGSTIALPLASGSTVAISSTPRNLNFLVEPSSAEPLAKVQFDYDGQVNYRTEATPPLTFAGDTGFNHLSPWTPTAGNHTLTVTPFSQSNGVFIAGAPKVIHFTVTVPTSTTPPPTTPPPSTPSSPAQIDTVMLYSAGTLAPLSPIQLGPNVQINLGSLSTHNLNLKITAPSDVTQVRFSLDDVANYHTETAAPFYMAGNAGSWTPSVGTHTVIITPYNLQQGTLVAGTPKTIVFTIADISDSDPPPPPPPPTAAPRINVVSLVTASSQTSVSGFDPFANGVTLNLATLPTRSLNVKAVASSDTTSVIFTLDGAQYSAVSSAPFLMAGPTGSWTPSLGAHTLVITPTNTNSSTGIVTTGTPVTINFAVTSVAVVDPPTIVLSSTPNVPYDGAVTVTWSTTNARAGQCIASGDWAGSQTLSGTITFSHITTNKIFNLNCTGDGGSANATARTTVGAIPPPPIPTTVGYTDISPKSDSRVIYVSNSSGDDANPGTIDSPVKTVAKAFTLVRTDFPDQILLKKGDTWTGSIQNYTGTLRDNGISGRSATEKFVLSSYGTGQRPLINTPDGTGAGISLGYKTTHFAIVGIHFRGGDRGDGIELEATPRPARDLLIEDCYIERYSKGIDVSARPGMVLDSSAPTMIRNVSVRRNIVVDNYSLVRPQGGYFEGIDGLLIEENIMDNNGRRPDGSGGTVFDHSLYITGLNWNVIVRNNILSNAASDSLQARSGGIIEGNFFYNNPIHMSFGYVNGGGHQHPGGVQGVVRNNVMIKTRDINAGPDAGPRGIGMYIANVAQASITDNILAFNTSNLIQAALDFEPGGGDFAADAIGIHNINIDRNIVYSWPVAVRLVGFGSPGHDQWSSSNVTLTNNYFGGLVKRSVILAFPNGTANATINTTPDLTPNFDPFITQARLQSKDNWRTEYTAQAAVQYVKSKF